MPLNSSLKAALGIKKKKKRCVIVGNHWQVCITRKEGKVLEKLKTDSFNNYLLNP